MPIARVQLPDGRIGRFEVPEGTQPSEVEAFINSQMPQQEAAPTEMPQEALTTPDNTNNILTRTGRIATNIVGNIADLPVATGQAGYDFARGVQQLTGAEVAPAYKIPLPSEMALAAYDSFTSGKGKATGAAKTLDEATAIVAPMLPAIAQAVPAITNKALPKIEGSVKALAARAKDFNIPLSFDQVAPTRVRNTLQKVSQEIPFSGVDKFQAQQTQAFNRALAKTIGQDADDLGPQTIQNYLKDSSGKFNQLLTGKQVMISDADVSRIKGLKDSASVSLGSDSLSVVKNNINQALRDIKTGNITGEKLANVRSYFLDNAANAEGGAKKFIGKIVDSLDDIAANNLSKDEVALLAQARNEWKNYRTIEPLLEKSVDGYINPTELLNRVKATPFIKASRLRTGQNDLVDLARIGKQFLTKKGGSDTFQKSIIGGGLGTLGIQAATNPLLAAQTAAIAGTGIGLNRGYQGLNQSQTLLQAALNARTAPQVSMPNALLAGSALLPRTTGE